MKKFLSLLLVSMVALGSVNMHAAQESSTPEAYKIPKRAYIVPAAKIGGGVLSLLGAGGFLLISLHLKPKELRTLMELKTLVQEKIADSAARADLELIYDSAISKKRTSQWFYGGLVFHFATMGLISIIDGVRDIKILRNRKAKSYYCYKSPERDVYIILERDENTQRSKVVKIIPATEK